MFLHELRNAVINLNRYENENSFSDIEFECMAPATKAQFPKFFTYCDPVPHQGGHSYVTETDLLMFQRNVDRQNHLQVLR